MFYKIQAENEPRINTLAAYLTGTHGMSHVELRFRNGESLSIFQDETVFLKKRGYSNKQYTVVPLTGVTPQQEAKMYAFAKAQVGKQFNQMGLATAWVPCCRRRTDGPERDGTWFCSELVTATLQEGGHLPTFEPNGSSPNGLYRHVSSTASSLGAAIGVNTLAFQHRQHALQMPGLTQINGEIQKHP